jgi:S-DNA-T family DNA segregation ATPase FtsK/SpoIIIE
VAAAAETLSRVREELDRRLSEVRRAVEAGDSAAPASWPQILVVVDEVAELTVRDLGDDRAARAAQQAATGRLCEIARLGRSVDIHLVCCTQRPDAEAVPGQLKANLDGTVAFRVRAAVNSFILLDSDRASLGNADLARAARVSAPTVTAALSGRPVAPRTLMRIAVALADTPPVAGVDDILPK